MLARTSLLGFLLLAACNSHSTAPLDGGADGSIAFDAAIDAAPDAGSVCPRLPGDPNAPRKVVVSHPFTDTAGVKGTTFEVLDLSAAGALTRENVTFQMGAAFYGPIVFTPDGKVGLVAQDDGSVGVFRFDASGNPVVVHAAFRDGFYAQTVVVDPDGSRAWVLDADTAANGGGVYEVAIGCDGTLTSRGLAVPGGTANAMAFAPISGQAVLAAGAALDSPAMTDTHLLELASGPPARVASGNAFGDGMAIVSSVAIPPDGKFAILSDNGLAAGNRLAVIALPQMTPVGLLSTPNPAEVVASPFGNAALLLNSDGMDALRVLAYDPSNATAPFTITGEVSYQNGKPQLPAAAVVIGRGALKGTVLVAENLAVRELTFSQAGAVTDEALMSFGTDTPSIVGTVGVQP
ncbi:MAG TPA: hypothetical protein VII38_11585 [Polyangia bacterium]